MFADGVEEETPTSVVDARMRRMSRPDMVQGDLLRQRVAVKDHRFTSYFEYVE
jgi:hypothetical protein